MTGDLREPAAGVEPEAGVRKRLRAAPALVAAGLMAASAAGCGAEATVSGGLDEKAESTVSTLLETCARGDGEAVLGLLTPPAREMVIGAESVSEGCDRVLGLGVESEVEAPTAFRAAEVVSVEMGDDIGSATIRAESGESSEVELENSGDSLLVTNPLP